MTLPQPCLETGCMVLSYDGRSRCAAHTKARGAAKNAKRRNGGGERAQARMRYRLKSLDASVCWLCRIEFRASALQVDHILALADGGVDTESNLQVLCKPCHDNKSADENKRRRAY